MFVAGDPEPVVAGRRRHEDPRHPLAIVIPRVDGRFEGRHQESDRIGEARETGPGPQGVDGSGNVQVDLALQSAGPGGSSAEDPAAAASGRGAVEGGLGLGFVESPVEEQAGIVAAQRLGSVREDLVLPPTDPVPEAQFVDLAGEVLLPGVLALADRQRDGRREARRLRGGDLGTEGAVDEQGVVGAVPGRREVAPGADRQAGRRRSGGWSPRSRRGVPRCRGWRGSAASALRRRRPGQA